MPHSHHAFCKPALLTLALVVALGSSDAHAAKKKPARAPAVSADCSDFYGSANAAWLKANPLPTGFHSVTALAQMRERSQQQQRELLDAAMRAPQDDVEKLLGDFWASGLDEAAVEADGAKPIAPLLGRINGIKKAKDVPAAIAALHQVGIPVLFNFSPDVDLQALDRHIGYFMQGGMGLPDPAYYTRTDEETRQVLGRYQAYVKQILALTGTPADKLEADSMAVLEVETRIARASKSLDDLRSPANNYAPVATRDLGKQYRNLQLDAFLKAQGVNDDTVSLANPALFKQLDSMIPGIKPQQWQAYLRWRIGDAMAPYLSRSFRDAEFGFRGALLRGESAPAPRWQHVLDSINTAAGPMLGREYAERHLPADSKAKAERIAMQVRDALGRGLERNTWMSAAAKAEAKAKLDRLKIEIGTPRRDLDYTVQPMGRGSFGSNMLIASTWRHGQEMKRIGKGNADRRWDVLPQEPALAYDIAQNRLIATAAALQAPIFDAARPELLYGAFGALVGSQLNRAIDAQGSHVDARGQVRDWWSPADRDAWTALGNRVAAQYASQDYPGVKGARVDGALVRNVALADQAGLELAATAHAKAQPQASQAARQALFEAWSRLWAQQVAANTASERLKTDIHAPGPLRSNLPAANLPEFAAAFACKPGQPMTRAEADQVKVWR